MKTSPHPEQLFMPEELEAWAVEDFSDLPLPRKALTDGSIETFRGRSGPLSLDQHLFESLFDLTTRRDVAADPSAARNGIDRMAAGDCCRPICGPGLKSYTWSLHDD